MFDPTKLFTKCSNFLQLVEQFGIDPNNAFAFWDWVGGRYSGKSFPFQEYLGMRHKFFYQLSLIELFFLILIIKR